MTVGKKDAFLHKNLAINSLCFCINTINCSDLRLRVELCPVTDQVASYSAHVKPNGNKLDFQNVRYQQESGVYQCVAENAHGMIVSYTVRGKDLENYIYTIEPSLPYYKSGLYF